MVFSWIRKCHDFKVLKRASVYRQPYQRAVFMPSLKTGRTGIDVQQVKVLVVFYLQDV